LYYYGPQAHFFTDTSGGGDPSPKLASNSTCQCASCPLLYYSRASGTLGRGGGAPIHPPPQHSQPPGASGCSGNLSFSHKFQWGQLSLVILVNSSNYLSTQGGVGAWGMPPRTPLPPPHLESRGGGGATHHLGSPLFFIRWCGSPDPTHPPWGSAVNILLCLVLTFFLL